MARNHRIWGRFRPYPRVSPDVSESLTSPESRENIGKILVETPRLESPDDSAMTRTILQTSNHRLPIALSVALLGACVANLALVCAWL
jgi:hypothetical protein